MKDIVRGELYTACLWMTGQYYILANDLPLLYIGLVFIYNENKPSPIRRKSVFTHVTDKFYFLAIIHVTRT